MAEWTPPEEMARRYQHLDEKNWQTIKSAFEKLLKLDRLDKISEYSLDEFMCFLERIKVIDWSKTKKQDVADFLLKTVIEMLKKENYLKNAYPQSSSSKTTKVDLSRRWYPYDLLLSILETHGFLSEILRENDLNMIWEKYNIDNSTYGKRTRNSLLETVAEQIKFPESVKLLEKWKISGNKFLTKEQLTTIDRYILMHEIALPENEEEAWEIFWNQVKPEPITKVISSPFLRILISKLMDMKRSRHKLNPHIVIKIIDNTEDFYKKYAFVQVAMFMNNANMNPLMENRSEYYTKLETIIKKMSAEIDKNTHLKRIDKFLDYNKMHIEYHIEQQK